VDVFKALALVLDLNAMALLRSLALRAYYMLNTDVVLTVHLETELGWLGGGVVRASSL